MWDFTLQILGKSMSQRVGLRTWTKTRQMINVDQNTPLKIWTHSLQL